MFVVEDALIMASVDMKWFFEDVMKFVLLQPEVEKIVLDNTDYYPGHFDDEDEL